MTELVKGLSEMYDRSAVEDTEVLSLSRAVLVSNSESSGEPWPAAEGQQGTQRQPSSAACGRDGSYLPERRCRRTIKTTRIRPRKISRNAPETPSTITATTTSSSVSRDIIQSTLSVADDVTSGSATRRDVEVRGSSVRWELVDVFISGSGVVLSSAVELRGEDVVVVTVVNGSGIMG